MTSQISVSVPIVGPDYPLSAPISAMEIDGIGALPAGVPIRSVLALDPDWDWVAEHQPAIAEAARIFAAAVTNCPVPLVTQWISSHFLLGDSGFTFATRGDLHLGTVAVAAFEVDKTGVGQARW